MDIIIGDVPANLDPYMFQFLTNIKEAIEELQEKQNDE